MNLPSPGPNPTAVRWRIVLLLAGLVFLAHFNRISISVAANAHFIGPGGLSEEQMGLVYSAFLLVYTLGMLPGGWLIDRAGPRRAMTGMGLGLGFWAAITGVLGWAGMTIAALFVPLLVIRGLAGATSVPLHPGAARAVSLWLPVRERSTANGLITAGALLGIALTYPVFGQLMDWVGWPVAFVVCGSSLSLFALLWHGLAADRPADHPATNDAERDLVAGEGTEPHRPPRLRDVFGLFRNRSLVLLTLSYGAVGYVQYLFFYWIEYYFTKELRLSPAESRDSAFTIALAMAVGMAAGGRISDSLCRRLGHEWGCRVVASVGMTLGAVFSLLGLATTDPQAVTVCFALALGSVGLCESVFWTTAPLLEPHKGGLACALVNTLGNGVGMLAPVVTPILGQHLGWSSAIVVACVVCAVGGSLWLGIRDTAPEPGVPPSDPEYDLD